jgi:hypothetical protein
LKNIPLLGALVWPKLIFSTHNGEGKAVVLLENDLSVTLKKNIMGRARYFGVPHQFRQTIPIRQ